MTFEYCCAKNIIFEVKGCESMEIAESGVNKYSEMGN